jgi:hypothetical protein
MSVIPIDRFYLELGICPMPAAQSSIPQVSAEPVGKLVNGSGKVVVFADHE